MRPGFAGFPKEFLTFFRALEKNNDREWFQARKDVFDRAVKAPMYQLIEAINGELIRFAPDYVTEPAKSMYRIYRDTRFSKDKTPYKTHAAAYFRKRGLDKGQGAGFYFGVTYKEVQIASGLYMPMPQELLTVRTHVAANHEEFRKIVRNKKLVAAMGEFYEKQLSRVPKGFPADHPAADLVRHKQFLFYRELGPEMITTPELFSELVARLKVMTPFVEFLNGAFRTRKPAFGVEIADPDASPKARARRAGRS